MGATFLRCGMGRIWEVEGDEGIRCDCCGDILSPQDKEIFSDVCRECYIEFWDNEDQERRAYEEGSR